MPPRSLGFLSLFFLLLPVAAGAVENPKLVIEENDYSFGQVLQGTRVEHVFRFRNDGEAPLLVEKVRSSCGCTAALASMTEIPPGTVGELRTTFDSGRFHGSVVKTVYLYVNDPLQSVAQFYLRGVVKPEFLLEPEQVDLGKLAPGATAEVRVTLTNQGEQAISLSPPESTAPELQVELASGELPAGKSTQLVVRGTAQEGKTGINGYVLIKTGSPRMPELRLPVYGRITANAAGR